ncbi:MAG: class I SAM-dependent methyltransferase [Alphaproteobacteria bacterium]
MEPETYRHMAAVEESHWWFKGRRRIVTAALQRLLGDFNPDCRILELGCGVGGNLEMLSRFGRVDAVEPDAWAAGKSREKGCATVLQGALPDLLPEDLAPTYDLIAMLDVLEHIDDAPGALAAIHGRIVHNGRLLLTVPAYPWMYGDHDRRHHHLRRYTRSTLRAELRGAGFDICFMGHFNLLLLPPAVLVRLAQRYTPFLKGDDEARGATGPANAVLNAIFALEAPLAARIPFPAGLSILAVARPV